MASGQLTPEEVISRIKGSPYREPPEECLRCDEPHDFIRGVNLNWQTRGSLMEGESPELVGGICADCLNELLNEWGYPEVAKCD